MQDILERASRYGNNCEVNARAHYLSSDHLENRHRFLGIPVTVASTIVGTSIFATLQGDTNIWLKIVTGLISITAALLSGLQTFLNYSEKSQKHKMSGATYSSLRRDLEIFNLRFCHDGDQKREEALKKLESLAEILTKLAKESPSIPDIHWHKAYIEVYGHEPQPSPIVPTG